MNRDKNIRKIILRMVEKIKTEYQPERIVLFGSYSWGKPTRDSDVDLLIIKKTNERHIDRAVRVREIVDKENRMVPLDIVVYTPQELKQRLKARDYFIKKILTKGDVIYEQE
ncbi:MAG: nucleotidyltransferase domain-containing protein [Candidatus Cloacimonetes bacterium]|nr:nucleotidyltransferase domain-containing protein [Candidatus Cloacimonadota bacterium]